MNIVIHGTGSSGPPPGYVFCKLMSWGYTVKTFLRPPPGIPFHPATWAFIREDIPSILCDGDVSWWVLFTHSGLNPVLIQQTVRAKQWSRK